jgi:hypothetical protein
MLQQPVSPEPGRDADPGRAEEDWLAWCESVENQLDPDEEEPAEDFAPWDVDIDAIIAECQEITAEEAAFAVRAAARGLPGGTPISEGRRGPGQPGSTERRPGEFLSRAAGFGAGMLLDTMPGCGALAGFAAEAAGEDDRYEGACDDEVAGAVSAWDRVEAYAAARKHAAVAEFIRRRPRPGSPLDGQAHMPEDWDESITAEVAGVLAESRHAADAMLGLAHDLEVKLPGTKAAFYELAGLGPVDPWLARDLADAAAASPSTTWCVTVTDEQGHAVAHGCARPEPKSHRKRAGPGTRDDPGFSFAPTAAPGTWRLRVPGAGPDLLVRFDPIDTERCDHRFEAKGHDPGVKLRHLSQVRHATCTSPVCRRPATQCDVEHNNPYEAGGRTCLCNTGPKCRHDHRLKQHPKWKVDQLPDGTFRWTTPAGRSYDTEPTRYPV